MTSQADILDDPNYLPILDHGFVGIVATMGSDAAIVQAARVSYGAGTKSVREDRGLIRYLFRHAHSSPIEMNEIKFHIRCPIFVMRQLIRHRTAATNEYSGRYSVMTDEFYIPDLDMIAPQSNDNKQGRAGGLSQLSKTGVQWLIEAVYDTAYKCYQLLLNQRDVFKGNEPWGAFDPVDPLLDHEFPGIARELARTVLPVGNYTECYWKVDLSNLFKFLKLRMDRGHAQPEIVAYADAIYQLIEPLFPHACEAFVDYSLRAYNLSRMEVELVRRLMKTVPLDQLDAMAVEYGMNKRELVEFREHFFATDSNDV